MSIIEELRRRFGIRYEPHHINSLWYVVWRATGCRNIYIPDRHMDPMSWDEISTIYHYFSKDLKPSTAKWYDCDDQARNFWNYARNYSLEILHKNGAIAYLWTVRHALCLFVDEESHVHFIETYSGKPTQPFSRVRFVLF